MRQDRRHSSNRREFLVQSLGSSLALASSGGVGALVGTLVGGRSSPLYAGANEAAGGAADDGQPGAAPLAIGSRRELFIEDGLVGSLEGAERILHKPVAQDVAIVCDKPWEGNTSAYFTIFRDDDRFRMYYRGSHWDVEKKREAHREVACYAESRDGLTFTKPELGLCDFDGSKRNNIVWDGPGTHNFTPFKDTNPACQPEARYKALAVGRAKPGGKNGLLAFQSPDGVRWSLMTDEPVITIGAFDSQNLAFWDAERRLYVDYHRVFHDGIRDIVTCTSSDFLTWTKPEPLHYGGAPQEHLYTNAIQPYFRAPHVLIGFPTRFQPKTQQVEPILMASRDGRHFQRWNEALIPITAPKDRDGNRSNYMTWGLVQLAGDERHLSVYAKEAYYAGPGSRLRRFTFRVDGFVSVHAGNPGGQFTTRPVTFTGDSLSINAATTEGGKLTVELLDETGKPYPGFAAADCQAFAGDSLDHRVQWKSAAKLGTLAGQPVRIRFQLLNADLYSLRFS